MWSREFSLKQNMWHFQFLLDWSAYMERYILMKTSPESDQWFQSYEQLKDSQNNRKQTKRNAFLFLATSHNQCSWLQTDSARSQRIYTCTKHQLTLWAACLCCTIFLVPLHTPVLDSSATRTWPSLAQLTNVVSPLNGMNLAWWQVKGIVVCGRVWMEFKRVITYKKSQI